MKLFFCRSIISLLLLFCKFEAYAQSYYKIIYVADSLGRCTVDTSKNCLLIRENPGAPWQLHEQLIQGFDYKVGNEYCLLVKVEADSILKSLKISLEEIKSIKKHPSQDTLKKTPHPFMKNRKWMLYKLKTKDELKIFTIAKAILTFDSLSNQIKLNLDCAQYSGMFTSENDKLNLESITSLVSTCKKRSIEDDLIKMLSLTNHYKMRKKELLLFNDDILLSVWLLKK